MAKDLEYYKDCFSSLNTMKKYGKPAPHKALLLLSVIDLIERGEITNCRIPISNDLVRQFKRNTSALLGESKLFQPVANYPYYHMKSEPFWQLVAILIVRLIKSAIILCQIYELISLMLVWNKSCSICFKTPMFVLTFV